MTGAEAIIQEYLDRGYSMRALRLLAESWSGAVGARMLAILDGMSPEPGKESDPENASVRAPDNVSGNVSENASGEAAAEDSGPCETAAYPVADAEADVVYFVADDEEAASREETVDEVAGEAVDSGADIMAETAAEGDSVADILIGETEGSEILRPRSASGGEGKAGLIAAEAGRHQEQNGILNRLWSRVAAKAGPTVTQPFAHTLALYEARRHVAGQAGQTGNSENGQWGGAERGGEKAAADPDESPMSADGSTVSEVAGSEMFFEAIAEESSAMLTEAAEVLSEAARTRPAAEPEAEPESEPEPSGEGPESPVRPEGPPAGPGGGRDRAEMDSDYIPRQDGDLYEEVAVGGGAGVPVTAARARRALMEAQAALDAPENAAGSGEKEKEKENGGTAEGPTPEGTGKISRRERRRRERAQKKKEKKTKKPGVDDALPEIVLTRSEGTETMMPEVCGIAAGGNGSAGAPETEGEAAERGFAEPSAVGESVSLLTPHDLLGESSSAAELFAFDGDAPAEEAERRESPERDERPEQAEEAGEIASPEAIEHESEADVATDVAIEAESEFPVEPGDHLMIIAGGGIPYEDYSRLVDESGDAAVRDGGKDWEEESNVILFNEKFPVFAGVRGEELDEYDEEGEESAVASGYLRLLPTGSFESEDEAGEGGEGSEADVIPYPSLRVLEYAGPAEEPAEILAEAPTEELAEEPIEEPLAEEPVEEPAAEPAAESIAEPMAEPAAELIALSGFEPEPSSTRHELGAADRLVLFRAVYGMAADSEVVDAESEAEALSLHAIVSEEPESQPVDALEREAAVRAEMEAEYQKRLDEFAGRILQAELAVATEKERVRQKQTELEARSAIIEEMQKRAAAEALQADSMAGRLAEANSGVDERDRKLRAKDKELEAFAGMREEHLRLYNEFEDLRRAYNEVVSDVLPKLQGERDDLALTVERQCSSEDRLRLSLGTVRRRMAVGYSLAGAACLALCALPVANWLSSGKTERQAAEDRQKMAELHETLQREVQNNIVARNTIVELENKMGMARAQLSDLHKKNQELARLSRSRQPQGQNQDVAVFKPPSPQSAGTPARTSDMALQATVPAGGRLHVNQVRDPSGSIEELALQNRYLHTQPQSGSAPSRQMAGSGESPRAVPMSMAARSDVGQGMRPRGDESAPPVAMVRNVGARQGSRLPARAEIPRQDEVVTRVKKGEGVAQVVYRVLGTWDPEVIAWVVRANRLELDKRGNPRIHPDQELRIPAEARSGQSASINGFGGY